MFQGEKINNLKNNLAFQFQRSLEIATFDFKYFSLAKIKVFLSIKYGRIPSFGI